MILRTSYHTHNRYCDGRGEIADYAAAAAAVGLEALGVTSHSPLPFHEDYAMPVEDLAAYRADVARVRAAYAGRLRVHLGLEFDYLPEYAEAAWAMLGPQPFDYLIGSVHFLGADARGVPSAYDLSRGGFERGLDELFGGDVRAMIAEYYRRVRALVAWRRTAILGHFDRIKMWNGGSRYFDEQAAWYRDEVEATLQACAGTGIIVEVNTSGWRHAIRAPYPSPWIVRRCLDLEVPLVVTTDAHAPERVTEFHEQAAAMLLEVGCTRLAVLRDGGWTREAL